MLSNSIDTNTMKRFIYALFIISAMLTTANGAFISNATPQIYFTNSGAQGQEFDINVPQANSIVIVPVQYNVAFNVTHVDITDAANNTTSCIDLGASDQDLGSVLIKMYKCTPVALGTSTVLVASGGNILAGAWVVADGDKNGHITISTSTPNTADHITQTVSPASSNSVQLWSFRNGSGNALTPDDNTVIDNYETVRAGTGMAHSINDSMTVSISSATAVWNGFLISVPDIASRATTTPQSDDSFFNVPFENNNPVTMQSWLTRSAYTVTTERIDSNNEKISHWNVTNDTVNIDGTVYDYAEPQLFNQSTVHKVHNRYLYLFLDATSSCPKNIVDDNTNVFATTSSSEVQNAFNYVSDSITRSVGYCMYDMKSTDVQITGLTFSDVVPTSTPFYNGKIYAVISSTFNNLTEVLGDNVATYQLYFKGTKSLPLSPVPSLALYCNLSTFNITQCVTYLFFPSADDYSSAVNSVKSEVINKAPIGYFTRLVDIFKATSTEAIAPLVVNIRTGEATSTSLTFDIADTIAGAGTLLENTRDYRYGKNLKDVFELIVSAVVAIAVVLVIVSDLTGIDFSPSDDTSKFAETDSKFQSSKAGKALARQREYTKKWKTKGSSNFIDV